MCYIDKKKFEEILQQVGSLHKHSVMTALFKQLCSQYDLAHLHFSAVPMDAEHDYYVLTTFPDEWMEFYYGTGIHKYDPLRMQAYKDGTPVSWRDLKTDDVIQAGVMRQRELMLGLNAVTAPFFSSNGHRSLLTVCGRRDDENWRHNFSQNFIQFKQLGMAMHAAVLKLWGEAPPEVQLSSRHIDCLKMLASGLNEKQISSFLKIGEKSVKTYINEAKTRLNAKTKVQVVANALAMGVISLS